MNYSNLALPSIITLPKDSVSCLQLFPEPIYSGTRGANHKRPIEYTVKWP